VLNFFQAKNLESCCWSIIRNRKMYIWAVDKYWHWCSINGRVMQYKTKSVARALLWQKPSSYAVPMQFLD